MTTGDAPRGCRLFAAVDLDEQARDAADDALERLKRSLGEEARELSWVRRQNLHVTLAFIGAATDVLADRLRRAFEPPFPTSAFEAGLGVLGAFPGRGRARVVWLGVSDGAGQLAAIHAEAVRRLQAAGIGLERRPYSAHVTIARVRRPDGSFARRLASVLDDIKPEPARWLVDHITLYNSRLSSSGSVYTPVIQARLDRPPAP